MVTSSSNDSYINTNDFLHWNHISGLYSNICEFRVIIGIFIIIAILDIYIVQTKFPHTHTQIYIHKFHE